MGAAVSCCQNTGVRLEEWLKHVQISCTVIKRKIRVTSCTPSHYLIKHHPSRETSFQGCAVDSGHLANPPHNCPCNCPYTDFQSHTGVVIGSLSGYG